MLLAPPLSKSYLYTPDTVHVLVTEIVFRMKSMQVQFNCSKQTLKVQSNIQYSWTHTHLPSLKMEWTPQLTTVTRVRWHKPNTHKNCMVVAAHVQV